MNNTKLRNSVALPMVFVVLLLLAGCAKQAAQADSSIKKIQDRGELIVGMDVPYGVMEYFDDNGNIVGLDADIAKAIADNLGVKLRMVDYDWERLLDAVKSGEVDLLVSSLTITPERAQEMLISKPYFNAGQVLVTRVGDDSVLSICDLNGKKAGAQLGTTGENALRKYALPSDLKLYVNVYKSSGENSLEQALEQGEIDAAAVDYVAGLDLAKKNPALHVVGLPFTDEYYGIATMKGNTALMVRINNLLSTMQTNGKLQDMTVKWTEQEQIYGETNE